MGLSKDVIVLGAKKLDFQNGADSVRGTQVWYHDVQTENTDEIKGLIPKKAWLPLEQFPVFANRNYPLKASIELDVDLNKNKLIPKEFLFQAK